MSNERKALMRIHTAGNVVDDLLVVGLHSCCGPICDGVAVRIPGDRGAYIISRKDIKKLAMLLEKNPPIKGAKCYHGRKVQ